MFSGNKSVDIFLSLVYMADDFRKRGCPQAYIDECKASADKGLINHNTVVFLETLRDSSRQEAD